MVYVLLVVGGTLSVFWLLALVFASTTKGERSLAIPGFFTAMFVAFSGWSVLQWMEVAKNPEKLTKESYLSLRGKEGLKIAELSSVIGAQPLDMSSFDKEQLERFDLTSNRIRMPGSITNRLSPGVFASPRVDPVISLVIDPYQEATVSKRGEKNTTLRDENGPKSVLGSGAVYDEKNKQGHGLVGLVVRFYLEDKDKTEELKKQREEERLANKDKPDYVPGIFQPVAQDNKEWIITEGEDWKYEDNMTPPQVAEAIANAITAKLSDFVAVYELDEDAFIPNSNVSIRPKYCLTDAKDEECPDESINPYSGEAGNQLRAQVMTGPNDAVKLGRSTDSSYQQFFGGSDAVSLFFWKEEEVLIDDDFRMNPRLVVAGLVRNQLVALGQNGLDITKELEPMLYEGEGK